MDARTHEKEALFAELYHLDESESDGDVAPLSAFTKPKVKIASNSATPKVSPSLQSPGRTVSAPLQSNPSPQPRVINIIEDSPRQAAVFDTRTVKDGPAMVKRMPISKSFTNANDAAKMKGLKAGAKRKRRQSLEVLPESQRIFTGLSFFFIPNDDVAPARKIRVRKTLERGALWVREWRDGITHVIVDDDRTYHQVISFLKIPSIPPGTALVNEGYTADCIKFNDALPPDQPQYRIDGHPAALSNVASVPTSSSNVSLQLKPDKSEHARHQQTQSKASGSEQESIRLHLREAEARAAEQERQLAKQAEIRGPTRDALDEAIDEARTVRDLPMDLDEDDAPTKSFDDADSADEHSEDEKLKKKPKLIKASSDISWQHNFNCMQKHDGRDSEEDPNCRTTEVLQQMADYYDRTNDHWRTTAYRRAISALRKQKKKIMTKEEAFAIPFIGERLAAKIEEIVWTDRLRRLDNTNLEPNEQVFQVFLGIYSVGIAQASAWIDQGFRTIQQLTEKAHLTKNQKIGIEHYENFLTRIPRAEVEKHGKFVREAIAKVDPTIEVTIGGSYRRKKSDSGDIDFIITKPNAPFEVLRTIINDTMIPRLFAANYLRVGLAVTAKEDGSKWHGAACLPGTKIWRRVDFLLVPWDEMGAALIYFTGNDIFNRSIRLFASKHGYRLNQRGLWRDVLRGKNRERLTQGTLVESRSERRIFEILGVTWRPPEHRNC